MTCSVDKTLALWDAECAVRIRKYKGHQTFVNACGTARRGPQKLCSGSDDGAIRVSLMEELMFAYCRCGVLARRLLCCFNDQISS